MGGMGGMPGMDAMGGAEDEGKDSDDEGMTSRSLSLLPLLCHSNLTCFWFACDAEIPSLEADGKKDEGKKEEGAKKAADAAAKPADAAAEKPASK
jgi:hypothetical protein